MRKSERGDRLVSKDYIQKFSVLLNYDLKALEKGLRRADIAED
jgi:hypothetical protein